MNLPCTSVCEQVFVCMCGDIEVNVKNTGKWIKVKRVRWREKKCESFLLLGV